MDHYKYTPQKLREESGYMAVGTVLMLTLVAIMGTSTIEISSADSGITAGSSDKMRAFYTAHAGLEWALHQLDQGEDPTVSGKSFDNSKFSVTVDADARTVAASGLHGIARARNQFNDVTFSADCFEFTNSPTFDFQDTAGTIEELKFHKTCHTAMRMTDMEVSWTDSNDQQKTVAIQIDGYDFAATSTGYHYQQTVGYTPVGSPSGGASSYPQAETIDIDDFSLTDTEEHVFNKIKLSYTQGYRPSAPETFTVTCRFADGSSKSAEFTWNETATNDGPSPLTDTPVITDGPAPSITDTTDTDSPSIVITDTTITTDTTPIDVVQNTDLVNIDTSTIQATSPDQMIETEPELQSPTTTDVMEPRATDTQSCIMCNDDTTGGATTNVIDTNITNTTTDLVDTNMVETTNVMTNTIVNTNFRF